MGDWSWAGLSVAIKTVREGLFGEAENVASVTPDGESDPCAEGVRSITTCGDSGSPHCVNRILGCLLFGSCYEDVGSVNCFSVTMSS